MNVTQWENRFLKIPKGQKLCSTMCIFSFFAFEKWVEYLFKICRSGKTAMLILDIWLVFVFLYIPRIFVNLKLHVSAHKFIPEYYVSSLLYFLFKQQVYEFWSLVPLF